MTTSPATPAATTATQNADLSVTPATERQVSFIYALGREAGLDQAEVLDWCVEIFGHSVEQITRKDASSFIDALQRRRTEVEDNPLPRPLPAEEDKDELVSVGVSKKPLEDDDTDF